MAGERLMADLRETVAADERLRLGLLGVPPQADGAAWGAAAADLATFYGRAFDRVRRALSMADGRPAAGVAAGSAASLLRAEALAGLALYRIWARPETPPDDLEQVSGMSRRWMEIVVLLGG